MQFDSLSYILFLPLVLLLFYSLQKQSYRILLLLIASYFFYACWHPAYLILIVLSTITDYIVALRIDGTEKAGRRKLYLFVSLLINLSILLYFKYYNFLVEEIAMIFNSELDSFLIKQHNYLLPIGISFYTFQTIGYTIDVYRKKIRAEKNYFSFALYVSFFPQLVAGPIERASNILPQLLEKTHLRIHEIKKGAKYILIGYVKKLLLADYFAIYVEAAYASPDEYGALVLIFATLCFGCQIYFDFSAYTDIARGSAYMFGIDLMENFEGPYLSKSIREFWRRWHISLSTWFRDYLYIPLGGNRKGVLRTYFNLFIVFVITGLWHGAELSFLVWGLIHGLFIVLERLFSYGRNPSNAGYGMLKVLYVWIVVNFSWIYFRAQDITEANVIVTRIFNWENSNGLNILNDMYLGVYIYYIIVILFLVFVVLHIYEYRKHLYQHIEGMGSRLRFAVYFSMFIILILFGRFYNNTEFIYFQF